MRQQCARPLCAMLCKHDRWLHMRALKSLLNREAVIPKSFCFSPLLSPLPCLCLYALACCVSFFRELLTIALPSIITHPSSDSFPIGTLIHRYRPTQISFFFAFLKKCVTLCIFKKTDSSQVYYDYCWRREECCWVRQPGPDPEANRRAEQSVQSSKHWIHAHRQHSGT